MAIVMATKVALEWFCRDINLNSPSSDDLARIARALLFPDDVKVTGLRYDPLKEMYYIHVDWPGYSEEEYIFPLYKREHGKVTLVKVDTTKDLEAQ